MYINLAQKFEWNLSFKPSASWQYLFKNLHNSFAPILTLVIIQLNHKMENSLVRVNV
jgi:hypothetical protein